MTKKKNLTAFMIAIIVMLFSLPANAQGTVGYVEWSGANTITFKGGTSVPDYAYALNTDNNDPDWIHYFASSCTKVKFDASFNNVRPTSCYHWFYEFPYLSTIEGIENLNTANVKNMDRMFYRCSKLESLDVSKFNTDNVTTMRAMFEYCSGLTTLDVSKFNTAKVKDMGFMFNGCSDLTSLDVSKFNTDSVTTMCFMFNGCSGLTSLDVSNFNTANVGLMYYMFNGCSGLTSLDLSNFNTAKVTDMEFMFESCSGLTSLDLSNFNTAKVTDMRYMFKDCLKLTTIYVSDNFTTGMFIQSTGMFENCTKLVGAVEFDPDKTDKEMANYKNGYFKTYFALGDSKVVLFGKSLTTTSLVLSDDKNFVAHAPFKASSVSYTRNLSSSTSKWYTLCLPFAYTPQNFTAYQLQSATANAVEIKEISTETIAAGTPVLFKFKDDVVDVDKKKIEISATGANIVKAPVVGTAVNGDDGSLQLYGTYQKKTFSLQDNNTFILLNNKLMNPAKMLQNNSGATVGLKPFHAYMTMTSQASAKSFSIGSGDEGTTAIDLLNSVATDDAEYYDINGRRIDAPAKGVNIVRRGNKTMKLIIK